MKINRNNENQQYWNSVLYKMGLGADVAMRDKMKNWKAQQSRKAKAKAKSSKPNT